MFVLPQEEHKEWFKCASQNDCRLVRGVCDWKCVNKANLAEAQVYYEHESSTTECTELGFDYPPPEPVCGFSLCQCRKSR